MTNVYGVTHSFDSPVNCADQSWPTNCFGNLILLKPNEQKWQYRSGLIESPVRSDRHWIGGTTMVTYAGFDRLSNAIAINGNRAVTGGLANCIAIAAYNQHQMAISHFHTLYCYNNNTRRFKLPTILRWRDWIRDRTGFQQFAVALGGIWHDTGPKDDETEYSAADNMRYDLIVKLIQTFNYEPRVTASCVEFGVLGGELKFAPADAAALPQGWGAQGTAIPYGPLNHP